MPIITDLNDAKVRDQKDPLARYRFLFYQSDPGLIYMDGNSLGKLPIASKEYVQDLVERQWGERLIRSWNEGWLEMPLRVGNHIAEIIGATSGEVIVADSTSVNLFKLITAALTAQSGRTKIITDNLNFPSDIYVMQGVINLLDRNHELVIIPSSDHIHGPEAGIIDAIDEHTALLSLSHTVFKSGYTYDMEKLTAKAHEKGVLVLWDLSHSVGAVPIHLNQYNVDLAVGCTYKYLNGGPGAPAFLYVNRALSDSILNPVSGWMGQENLFEFSMDYQPAPGIMQFMTGTPPVLSLGAIEKGVEMVAEAGMEALRAKSVDQTKYLIHLWDQLLKPLDFSLNSPREPKYRGSHVSIGHPEGLGIDLALINEKNIIPDFRAPDNIRLGIAPLYTSYEDIYRTIIAIKEILEQNLYAKYREDQPSVT